MNGSVFRRKEGQPLGAGLEGWKMPRDGERSAAEICEEASRGTIEYGFRVPGTR